MTQFRPDAAFARQLDEHDELAAFRERFIIDDPDLIYLDGNSLGRLLRTAVPLTQNLVRQQWGERLIRSWNEGWIELPARLGDKIGRLIGAGAGEVLVADSTSVNLFKLALAALRYLPERHKIVTDDLNFPSDLYVLQGVARLAGRPIHIEIVASPDGIHGPVAQLAEAIDDQTALVTLSHTVFKSSYTYDMRAMTEMAHRAGALMLWDMSHSAGSVPADLQGARADLAVGCTYKYLNGGPGAPAFLYAREDLQPLLENPITAWMGQRHMFDFDLTYDRAPGLRHFLSGTPPILSLAAMEPGLDVLLEAGIDRLRAKSVQQTEYLVYLWREWLAPLDFQLNTPPDAAWRGSHVSLGHAEGWRIDQALIHEMNVIPDFRKPDNIRLGVAPLYTSFMELHTAMSRLRAVVEDGRFRRYEHAIHTVT